MPYWHIHCYTSSEPLAERNPMKPIITRVPQAARRPGLALLGLFVLGLIQAAYAQTSTNPRNGDSIYTTVDEETVQTTDDGNGNTSSTTRSSTITTSRPSDAEMRRDAWENDPNARDFPYDSTGGAHRNDLDTARQGFDDPRNPWDGRYANDNPANHPVGSAYDRGEPVNTYRPGKYRPGAFNTTRPGRQGDSD